MLFTKGKKFKISCTAMTLVLAMLLSLVVVLSVSADSGDYDATTQTQNMVFGKTYSGTAGDTKYTFTLQQSGRVNVVSFVTEGYCYNVQIYDSTGSKLIDDYVWYDEDNNSSSVDLLAGDYVIYCDGGYDTNYSFTATFTPSRESVNESYMSNNNSSETATSYKLGKKVKAQLAANDDIDVYKFKVSKGGYLKLTLTLGTIKHVDFDLYDAEDGGVSYSESAIGSNYKAKYYVPAGTYYLYVRSKNYSSYNCPDIDCTGTYSITASYSVYKPTLKTKKVKKKSFMSTFSLPEYASGYQIQIATSKNFKKGKRTYTLSLAENEKYCRMAHTGLMDSSFRKFTFCDLKKNKTYYVRIRFYDKLASGKKVYSAWSNVKKVKTKK
jgi:hypothetical protein